MKEFRSCWNHQLLLQKCSNKEGTSAVDWCSEALLSVQGNQLLLKLFLFHLKMIQRFVVLKFFVVKGWSFEVFVMAQMVEMMDNGNGFWLYCRKLLKCVKVTCSITLKVYKSGFEFKLARTLLGLDVSQCQTRHIITLNYVIFSNY